MPITYLGKISSVNFAYKNIPKIHKLKKLVLLGIISDLKRLWNNKIPYPGFRYWVLITALVITLLFVAIPTMH